MSIYKYNSGKYFKSNKKYSPELKQTYLRSFNLHTDTISPGAILAMQNKIGNAATEDLLNYVGKISLAGDGDETFLVGNETSGYASDTKALSKTANEFKDIIGEQKNAHSETVKNYMGVAVENESKWLKFKHIDVSYLLSNLEKTALYLKICNEDSSSKAVEVSIGDMSLTEAEKEKIRSVSTVLDMIKALNKYDEEERPKYMSVLNMLISLGINVSEFLLASGHIDEQKKILYEAVGISVC